MLVDNLLDLTTQCIIAQEIKRDCGAAYCNIDFPNWFNRFDSFFNSLESWFCNSCAFIRSFESICVSTKVVTIYFLCLLEARLVIIQLCNVRRDDDDKLTATGLTSFSSNPEVCPYDWSGFCHAGAPEALCVRGFTPLDIAWWISWFDSLETVWLDGT